MAETLKVLGQASPAATTVTDLYTVPAATSTTVSTLTVCNQNATPIKFRVAVAIGGVALAVAQYLYFDVLLAGNASFAATIGLSLATGDVVRVRTDTTSVSFNLFGVEVS